VSVAVGRGAPAADRFGHAHAAAAAAGTAVLLALGAFLIGRSLAPDPQPADSVTTIRGIPVAVDHSPAGALAAADNYVAVSYATIERDPRRDQQLIDAVYAPAIRRGAIGGAATVRSQNAAAMSLWAHGGQNLSLIGARRLDYYRGDEAQVTTWNVDVFWGPERPPKQAWALTQTSLRWSRGRWLVTTIATLPTPGPVPAITAQATAANDSESAFSRDLAGFSSPMYGAPG
jgi:hypothetical protein